MDFYLIEIDVVSKHDGRPATFFRLVKAFDKNDAMKRAAENVNKINFEVVNTDSNTIIPEEYNGL